MYFAYSYGLPSQYCHHYPFPPFPPFSIIQYYSSSSSLLFSPPPHTSLSESQNLRIFTHFFFFKPKPILRHASSLEP